MNTEILDKYKISFEVFIVDGRETLEIHSQVISNFRGYFVQVFPEFLIEEVIPEIDKAMAGQAFDDDAGGVYDFLRIGPVNSYFYSNPFNDFAVPTVDLKEIILAYVDWIDENNLEAFI